MSQENDGVRFRNHAYLREDGSVDGEKLLKLVQSAPGGLDVLVAGGFIEDGFINPECEYLLRRVVEGLCQLAAIASCDGGTAMSQLRAVDNIVYPARCGVPLSEIEDIATRHTSAPLARAMELRAIMGNLSWVVVPASGRPCDVNQPVKLTDGPPKHCEAAYELAQKHWKPGTTLQALAIKVYLERLRDEGVLNNEEIDEGSLKRDLRAAREWEAAHLDERHWRLRSLNENPIRVFEFSQDWKRERRARNRPEQGEGKE